MPEFLRAQIETNSRVCGSVAEVRQALCETRALVIDAAARHGVWGNGGLDAHPFAAWDVQLTTPKERYERFAMSFQDSLRRFVAGGMHIHAGFGEPDSRIRVMTAMAPLPTVAARVVDLIAVLRRPRDGLQVPSHESVGALHPYRTARELWSVDEYEALVREYQRLAFIEEPSELWWDIRPSQAYPTVEMRICDTCTRIEDAMSIVALYACLVRRLVRDERQGTLPPEPPTELIGENRWLAQRYGVLGGSSATCAAADRVDIADGPRSASSVNWRTMPAPWIARPNYATCCPSSAKAAARTGKSTTTVCAAWRETRKTRPLRSVVDLIVADTRRAI